MGLISWIKSRFQPYALSVTDEKAWDISLWNLRGSQSLSGETVTESTALTYSAVWNAVSLISGTIGALPLHLLRKEKKKKVLADENGLYRVMHDHPNEFMTAMQFRECLMAHVLTWGNGFAEIVRNGYGDIIALWPIPPNRVNVVMGDDQRLAYEILVDNKIVTLPRERVLHVAGLGFDGFNGYSVIAMARKSIGLAMAMETFGSLFFGNGTHPGSVITHPSVVKDHKKFREAVSEVYGGLGKSHMVMLLEEGMKIEKVGIPPEDSQFLESRQFQIPEVARWFNLPPHKLKDLTRSSFSNIESEQISFVTDSILPWLIRLEQSYNMQLLSAPEQRRERLYFKHNVEGLLRGDAAARGTFYRELFMVGAISQNEIREKEDLDPDPNPLADERFVPLNMVPLSMVKEVLAKDKTPKTGGNPNESK